MRSIIVYGLGPLALMVFLLVLPAPGYAAPGGGSSGEETTEDENDEDEAERELQRLADNLISEAEGLRLQFETAARDCEREQITLQQADQAYAQAVKNEQSEQRALGNLRVRVRAAMKNNDTAKAQQLIPLLNKGQQEVANATAVLTAARQVRDSVEGRARNAVDQFMQLQGRLQGVQAQLTSTRERYYQANIASERLADTTANYGQVDLALSGFRLSEYLESRDPAAAARFSGDDNYAGMPGAPNAEYGAASSSTSSTVSRGLQRSQTVYGRLVPDDEMQVFDTGK